MRGNTVYMLLYITSASLVLCLGRFTIELDNRSRLMKLLSKLRALSN